MAGNGVRRRLAAANLRLCGSPVTMTSSTLAISFDRLLELCRAYLARYGKPAWAAWPLTAARWQGLNRPPLERG
jgi:hypothetical protein